MATAIAVIGFRIPHPIQCSLPFWYLAYMVVLGLEEEILRFEISMADVVLVVAVLDRPASLQ